MKKLIAFLLAAVMVLGLVACGASDEPAETAAATTQAATAETEVTTEPATEETVEESAGEPTQEPTEAPTEEPTEAPTEAPVEEPSLLETPELTVEELLLSEPTQTRSFWGHEECRTFLHSLGYVELYPVSFADSVFRSAELTYNSKAFKMTFSLRPHTDYGWTDSWTMYGAKAEGLCNISGLDLDAFDHQYVNDVFNPFAKYSHSASCPQYMEIHLAKTGAEGETSWSAQEWTLWDEWDWGFYDNVQVSQIAYCMAMFSPETGNVYNIVCEYSQPGDYYFGACFMEFFWEPTSVFHKTWNSLGVKYFALVFPGETELDEFIYSEPGMTWKDWAESKYNLDGWTYKQCEKHGELWSPDGAYMVLDGNVLINGAEQKMTLDLFTAYATDTTFVTYGGVVARDAWTCPDEKE